MTWNTETTAMAAIASAPILLILALMLGLRWSAARAGLAGLLLATGLAAWVFDFGQTGAGEGGRGSDAAYPGGSSWPQVWRDFVGVFAEGGFMSATILWILWPALALHHHQQHSGALDTLHGALGRMTTERPLQVLLVGWFLALFFEGAAGFGTPVALAAPILVGLGVPPLQAVVLALLGHAAGVSFGALGTPVLAQVALTGLGAIEIAWRTALLHALLGGLLMVFFMRTLIVVGPSGLDGGAMGGRRKHVDGAGTGARHVVFLAGWGALAAAVFLLPCLALAALLGPELATLGGALAGAAMFAAAVRWHAVRRAPAASGPQQAASPAAGLGRALWPYGVLVGLVLATRALPPVAEVLGTVTLQGQWFDRYSARMQPLIHPGSLLFVALLIGARLQRVPLRSVASSLAHAGRRLVPVTVALLAMLCLSRLMLHAGMIEALERAAVQGLGRAWPLAAPAVGALGSFVTGSATASNVLFTSLQAQTAQALGLPIAWLVAAQGLGAAIGNIVCPHNIIAGAATVGATGREAQILQHTLLPCAIYLGLGGALVAFMVIG